MLDLDLARGAIEGLHVDESEYPMDPITHDGRKHAHHRMYEAPRDAHRGAPGGGGTNGTQTSSLSFRQKTH